MPRIDCFKYIKGNKELEKHFSSIEEDLPESEQRSKSIELANEYYKKLHDEMNDLNILLKKQKVKFKSKNNSEEIKKVKEEADAKIKSLEQSFTQEQGNNANTNKSESNEKANETQKASNGESGESKVLNEIAQAEGADVQKASDTPRQMEGQKLDVEYKLRYPKNNVLVFVEPSMILDRLAKDDPEFDVQNPKNQIGSRVQKAKDYILNYAKDNRWINPKNGSRSDYSKATFEPSIVAIYNGKIGFEDGRHRILAAKELGISSIGIEVPKAQAEQFKKEFNTQTKNNKNETRKENSKDATKQQTTNGTTSKSDSEVSGQVAPKSDGRGRTKKSKRKVKNPEYLKALSFETVGSPYNYVLQYFIGGGGYSAELLRGLYGKSKGGGNDLSGKKSTIPSEELKSKIGFLEKNGATSSQVLGEKLSESYLDEFRMEQNESNDSQYFRNVIEDVINSFSSRRDMVDYLLKENNAELEYQYQEEYDGIYEQYGDFADQAIDYLSTLSDEQLQELLNDEEAFYQSDSYKELIGENNKGEENVKLSAKENNFVSSSKIDIDEKGNISLNRLSPAEEQGRNRSGEITTLATIVLSRLHSATREKYGNSSAELSTISNEEKKYLENFAKEQGVWVENADKKVGEFYDNGQEQSVYIDPKNPYVVNKLNNGSLEANWLEFLDRLALHNTYFPETAYILKGFGKDSGGNFVAILEQPFIQFTPMSVAEIKQHMIDVMGFELLSKYDDSIIGTIEEDRSFIDKKNGVIIEDLHAKNIYKDDKGNVFVIDPVMSLDTEDRGYGGTRTAELPSFESDAKLSLKVENKKPQNAKEKSTLKKLITTLQKAIKANVFSSQELLKQKLKEYGLDYTKFMQVWHGSPYVFDRFSLDKIGSGEGAQAFGWGLYFTDLKSIAKNYAERLNNINNVYVYNLNVSDNIKGIINESFYINNIYDTNITYEQKEIAKKWLEDSKYSKSEVEKQDIDKAISEIDNLEIKKSTYYKVSLHKGKAPSEYNWLEWDKEVSAETINQILESLSKQGKKLTLNRIDGVGRMVKLSDKDANLRFKNGSEVYNVLKNELGSDRQASLFLLENGIDGIKYPAESVARGATSDNARGFNYVVFDENVITIDERIQFMRTPNGVIYGAKFPDGSIYINNEDIDLSSPIHEFSHLFEEMFPELWSEGVRLFRDSSGFKKALEEVQKNKAYSNLTEQQQASEALNNLIGNKGVGYFAKGVLLSKFQNWVNKLFKTIGNRIGKKYVDKIGQKFGDKIAQKLTLTPDDSLDFFINDVLGKLLGGKELQGETQQNANENNVDSVMLQATSQAENITLEYNENGQHLAPNGKPSNLTEQQAKIVRTKAFKSWFGDWQNDPKNASKVVDENGEPLVVYHGTKDEFNEFDLNKVGRNATALGKGFYFTNSESIASSFGDTKSFFLRINNYISNERKTIKKSEVIKIIEELEKYDKELLSNYGDVQTEGRRNVLNSAIEDIYDYSDNDVDIVNALFNVGGVDREVVSKTIYKIIGKNGIVVNANITAMNAIESESVFVVISPNQIKLADGTNTTFSPDTNDIRFQIRQNPTQATKSEIENAISSLEVAVSDYANDDSIDNYLSLNDAFETLAYTSIGDAKSMAKDLSAKYPELKDDFDSIINEASKPKVESKKVSSESDAIRTLISEEVDARLYPTIVDSLGKFAKQDTAETTSKVQEREVSGEYVRLTLENMKDIAKQKALQLQEVLGEDWVKKSIEFFEREPFSGNPAIIIGLSNIISTDLDAQIKASTDIKELDALVALQNRMDRVVNRNGRVASLALNYRRIFTSFAQGDSVTDAMAGNNLTEESKKQIEVVKKAIAEQPTDEQLNSVGNVATPTTTPTKNTKSSRKTQTDSVLKSQIKNNAINSLTQVDENGKKTTKTWQDAVREANEESKKHKC